MLLPYICYFLRGDWFVVSLPLGFVCMSGHARPGGNVKFCRGSSFAAMSFSCQAFVCPTGSSLAGTVSLCGRT